MAWRTICCRWDGGRQSFDDRDGSIHFSPRERLELRIAYTSTTNSPRSWGRRRETNKGSNWSSQASAAVSQPPPKLGWCAWYGSGRYDTGRRSENDRAKWWWIKWSSLTYRMSLMQRIECFAFYKSAVPGGRKNWFDSITTRNKINATYTHTHIYTTNSTAIQNIQSNKNNNNNGSKTKT